MYGHPADLQPILELAREHNLKVIEDACQAHAATYQNQKIGDIKNSIESNKKEIADLEKQIEITVNNINQLGSQLKEETAGYDELEA